MALGIFENEQEAFASMRESIEHLATAPQLRRLFVDLLVNDCTETFLLLWNTFKDALSLDFALRAPNNEELILDNTLSDIPSQLEEFDMTLSDFGLPNPTVHLSEALHEIDKWALLFASLRTKSPMKDNSLYPSRELYLKLSCKRLKQIHSYFRLSMAVPVEGKPSC